MVLYEKLRKPATNCSDSQSPQISLDTEPNFEGKEEIDEAEK